MSGLKPIGSHMLKLILEYSKLAAALDTTRHHMSVNGVFIPQNHGRMISLCLVLCCSSFHSGILRLEISEKLLKQLFAPLLMPNVQLVFSSAVPSSINFSAALVNSQLVCLLLVGIFNHVICLFAWFVSLVSIGPEKPNWGSNQLRYSFIYFYCNVFVVTSWPHFDSFLIQSISFLFLFLRFFVLHFLFL